MGVSPAQGGRDAHPTGQVMTMPGARGRASPADPEHTHGAMPFALEGAPDDPARARLDAEIERARAARRVFGHFVLLGEVGRGGMGVVFRAWDDRLKRLLALKTISDDGAADPARLQRFRREAEAVARLRHPSIVSVFEAGEVQGKHYIAMELVEGLTLERRLAGKDRLALNRALEALRDVARAVQYAHEQGVIHRDLKPENILIDAASRPHVLDFGIAQLRGAATKITRTGTKVGTLAYMAPEQAGGNESNDERCDVYALGATLYHVLAGQPPFQGATPLEVLTQLLSVDPVPPSARNLRARGDLDTIVLTCLQKERTRRYASAAALADDLDRHLAGEPIAARPIGTVTRLFRRARRNKLAATLSLALVLAATGGSVALLRAREQGARAVREDRAKLVAAARAEASRRLDELARTAAEKDPGENAEARRRRDDRLLALGLQAFQSALHVSELEPGDTGARRLAFDASLALGNAALEAEQWSVASGAFESALALRVDDASAKKALAGVETKRTEVERARREAVESILRDARSGVLARRPDGFEDAFLSLLGYRDAATVRILSGALDQVAAKLPDLDPGEAVLAKLVCNALGRIGIKDGAVDALGRYILAETDQLRAAAAAQALCRLGGEEAERLVIQARERFGTGGSFWGQVRPLLDRTGVETKLGAGTSRDYFERGHTRYDKGDLDGAIEDFTRSIELEPGVANVWLCRGVARNARKDLDGALADVTRAIELEPGNVTAWLDRGSVRRSKGDLPGALADTSHAIELHPERAQPWTNRGVLRVESGDLDGGIADYSRSIELDATLSISWANRGIARTRKGDVEGALADFTRALDLDPRDGNTWARRALLRRTSGDLDGSIADYSRVLELDPGDASSLYERGVARKSKGDVEGAIADMSRSIEVDPRVAVVWNDRAALRGGKGDVEGAIADATRAIELGPSLAASWFNRAVARGQKGDRQGAIEDLERCAERAGAGDPLGARAREWIEKLRQ